MKTEMLQKEAINSYSDSISVHLIRIKIYDCEYKGLKQNIV